MGRRVVNTVCLSERIRDLCANAKQVIYASAFSTAGALYLGAEVLAELSLSLKKTIALEIYTQGCSKGPGQ